MAVETLSTDDHLRIAERTAELARVVTAVATFSSTIKGLRHRETATNFTAPNEPYSGMSARENDVKEYPKIDPEDDDGDTIERGYD